MAEQAPSGPGPLIWVVILLAAVAGALWGVGVAIGVGVGITILFVLIGVALTKSQTSPEQKRVQQIREEYRRKHGRDLPPLTDEMRGVFDRMLGREAASPTTQTSASLSAHLPRQLVPPAGRQLRAAMALEDMRKAIDAASNLGDKVTIFVTRCFDNAVHCDAKEWGPRESRETTGQIFSRLVAPESLVQLQEVAEEAVLLGYRAATPLDLSVILGQKENNSWKPELEVLVGRGRNCAAQGAG